MQKYKLIATDMDGTLLTEEKTISDKTKKTLIALQQKGIRVMLCSGRQFPGLLKYKDELKLSEYNGILAAYNGGKVVCSKTNKILFEKPIPNNLAIKIINHILKFNVNPIIDDGKYIYTTNPNGFKVKSVAESTDLIIKEVDNLETAINFSPYKILISAQDEIFKIYGKDIVKPFLNEIDYTYSTPYFLEITLKDINKGNCLTSVCKNLNISLDEVIAFGNGENDISMLEVAGLGVAMENSCDSLKKIANEITLSNNDDGVAQSLIKHFNL